MKKVMFVLAVLTLAGCTTVPDRSVMLKQNYGPPISKQAFEDKVRNESGFFDPYSAHISCTEPRKGWADYLYESKYGYISHCVYNAKNRFGAYVGEKKQTYCLSNGTLFQIYPRDWKYLQ